jgi:tripartite-type tricarboxylate transporter receptor subunit TctC
MKKTFRVLAACLFASALGLVAQAFAQASAYPRQTVKVLVPYSPGGLPDTVARVVGQKLSEKWGQPVVIENRPGGNGVISAQALMASAPDGYTLLVTDMSMFVINPFIYSKLPYDAQKDFTAISLVARAPLFLAVQPSLPANNFQEFVALAKAHPGTLSYGSSGIGSIHHLTFESIKAALGIDVLHVPFKGTGQSVPAVVAGQVSAVFSAFPSLAGFAKEGKLKLIAVNSKERSSLAPDVATIAETSIPGFDFAPSIGVWGPAGTPPAIAGKIAADVSDLLKDPALAERLHVLGIDPVGLGPQAFMQQLAADRERYERAVKVAGARAD